MRKKKKNETKKEKREKKKKEEKNVAEKNTSADALVAAEKTKEEKDKKEKKEEEENVAEKNTSAGGDREKKMAPGAAPAAETKELFRVSRNFLCNGCQLKI